MYHIISSKKQKRIHNQAGVTLLLSILILSGLTLITVTIGAFAIQELRSSRAVIVTEPAIAAAESAGEQGLWSLKRSGSFATCPTQNTQTLSNNTFINSCKSYGTATFTVKGGVPFTFYLYNPNDINGDVDLSGFVYNQLQVTHLSGTTFLTASVTRLDGSTTGITPAGAPQLTLSPGSLTGTVGIAPVAVTNPETEARMKVVLSSVGDATVEVNTNLGMPTFPTVDALGCASRASISSCDSSSQETYGRRINITVPQ